MRRCVICTLPLYEHTPKRLAAKGYLWHVYDPGDRRKGDRRK